MRARHLPDQQLDVRRRRRKRQPVRDAKLSTVAGRPLLAVHGADRPAIGHHRHYHGDSATDDMFGAGFRGQELRDGGGGGGGDTEHRRQHGAEGNCRRRRRRSWAGLRGRDAGVARRPVARVQATQGR